MSNGSSSAEKGGFTARASLTGRCGPAHVYWPFYPPWIAEGAAEFMASRVAELQPLSPCSLADTLGALDRLAAENTDGQRRCLPRLGLRLQPGAGSVPRSLRDALGRGVPARLPAAPCRDAGRDPRGLLRGRRSARVRRPRRRGVGRTEPGADPAWWPSRVPTVIGGWRPYSIALSGRRPLIAGPAAPCIDAEAAGEGITDEVPFRGLWSRAGAV